MIGWWLILLSNILNTMIFLDTLCFESQKCWLPHFYSIFINIIAMPKISRIQYWNIHHFCWYEFKHTLTWHQKYSHLDPLYVNKYISTGNVCWQHNSYSTRKHFFLPGNRSNNYLRKCAQKCCEWLLFCSVMALSIGDTLQTSQYPTPPLNLEQ